MIKIFWQWMDVFYRVKNPYNTPSYCMPYEREQTFILSYPLEFTDENQILWHHARSVLCMQPFLGNLTQITHVSGTGIFAYIPTENWKANALRQTALPAGLFERYDELSRPDGFQIKRRRPPRPADASVLWRGRPSSPPSRKKAWKTFFWIYLEREEENRFHFLIKNVDDELGLVYYNYRHFNPLDGKWSIYYLWSPHTDISITSEDIRQGIFQRGSFMQYAVIINCGCNEEILLKDKNTPPYLWEYGEIFRSAIYDVKDKTDYMVSK